MAKKIGISKVRPFNPDVRQGPKPRAGKPKSEPKEALELRITTPTETSVFGTSGNEPVHFTGVRPEKNLQPAAENAGQPDAELSKVAPDANPGARKDRHMNVSLKGLNKKGTAAIYSGLKTTLRFPLAAFVNKQAPDTIDLTGPFAEPAVKEPKVKLTPEERKAARAAKPKPTLAEKIAREEKRLEALRKQAAEAPAEM